MERTTSIETAKKIFWQKIKDEIVEALTALKAEGFNEIEYIHVARRFGTRAKKVKTEGLQALIEEMQKENLVKILMDEKLKRWIKLK